MVLLLHLSLSLDPTDRRGWDSLLALFSLSFCVSLMPRGHLKTHAPHPVQTDVGQVRIKILKQSSGWGTIQSCHNDSFLPFDTG